MHCSIKASVISLLALGAAAPAFAGCGYDTAKTPVSRDGGSVACQLIAATWDGGPIARQLTPVSLGAQGVVGLWSIGFTAGPVTDWGYSEWHADGSEIFDSGARSPAIGNVSLGVWRQTGANTYRLKNPAFGFDATTGALVDQATLTEDVTVDRTGNNFMGTIMIDVYDASGTTLQHHFSGTIVGHRVLPN